MSIASEITRLQGVKSDILTAISDKGVTVPAGSALDDCPSLIASIVKGSNSYLIGDKYYDCVKINGAIWMAENLDFAWEGLPIGVDGASSSPKANYYNNDQETFGRNGRKCGLMYNWHAVNYLNNNKASLISGWHVPTDTEWADLISAVGGTAIAGGKLKSKNLDWATNWNGSDAYWFAALPSGEYNGSSFQVLGSYGNYWSSSYYNSDEGIVYYADRYSTTATKSHQLKSWQFAVRLVKD